MKTLDSKAGPEELVPAIQQGDRELREQFLHQYQGFVAGTVSKALGGGASTATGMMHLI